MLFLLIPDRSDGDKGRRHRAFGESQHEPDCCETGETLRSCKTHAHRSPDDTMEILSAESWSHCRMLHLHCDANKLRQWEFRHEVDERVFSDELACIPAVCQKSG
jgi:hypothetical protein